MVMRRDASAPQMGIMQFRGTKQPDFDKKMECESARKAYV